MRVKEESEKAGLNSAFKKLKSWHLVPSLQKEESEKAGLNSAFKKLKSWHLVPSLHGK